jgi:NMD protein affecting ribosome stability and mRNA decay
MDHMIITIACADCGVKVQRYHNAKLCHACRVKRHKRRGNQGRSKYPRRTE